jgi:cytochrome c
MRPSEYKGFPAARAGYRVAAVFAAVFFFLIGGAKADMVGHGGMIRSITMSSDGQYAVTASFDYSARLWQFDEQRELRLLDGHDGPVNDAVFSNGDKRVVTAGADGKVIVWDWQKGRSLHVLNGHRGRAMSASTLKDGDTVLTGGWDGKLILWSLPHGTLLAEYETRVPITSVATGGGDRFLIAGGRDGVVRVVRRGDGIVVGRINAHDLGLSQLTASRDGRRLVTIGLDNAARVWDLQTLEKVSEYLPEPQVKPVSAALSENGAEMLIGYVDGNMVHLDAQTGIIKRRMAVEKGPVWAVAFTPDRNFALSAGVSERVRVWHLETGDRIDVASPDGGAREEPWLESKHPGARLFRKCANCHALTTTEAQRAGPHFSGLFGRRVGGLPNYRYSKALREADFVWSRETIADLFRQGPDRYLPGTKMPVQKIANDKSLAQLIDYLEQIVPAN